MSLYIEDMFKGSREILQELFTVSYLSLYCESCQWSLTCPCQGTDYESSRMNQAKGAESMAGFEVFVRIH